MFFCLVDSYSVFVLCVWKEDSGDGVLEQGECLGFEVRLFMARVDDTLVLSEFRDMWILFSLQILRVVLLVN